jgi:MFS family permease
MACSALGLVALSFWHGPTAGYYLCLLLRGIGAAFARPAGSALQAEVVPEAIYENSASWTTTLGQAAAIAGPIVGGFAIAVFGGTTPVYAFSMLANLTFVVILLTMRRQSGPSRTTRRSEQPTFKAFGEGIDFLRRSPILLSAITLDLFAVLFGGATALLPIFARDILQVGSEGLGILQSAPSVGAFAASFWLVHRPPLQRAGPTLLLSVAGFGLATIIFGLSESFLLSLAMLFVLGGLDGISMVVRESLMLSRIPDHFRGRVRAIESVFISSSNQLGAFESGVAAQLFGPILSVVGGGVGTILVVLGIAAFWPDLRRLRTTREHRADGSLVPAGASEE